jgi:hypothetical protein
MVKRFFVSEDVSSELKNLTEYRRSGTPGDFPGAVFWYFFAPKKYGGIRGEVPIGIIGGIGGVAPIVSL